MYAYRYIVAHTCSQRSINKTKKEVTLQGLRPVVYAVNLSTLVSIQVVKIAVGRVLASHRLT